MKKRELPKPTIITDFFARLSEMDIELTGFYRRAGVYFATLRQNDVGQSSPPDLSYLASFAREQSLALASADKKVVDAAIVLTAPFARAACVELERLISFQRRAGISGDEANNWHSAFKGLLKAHEQKIGNSLLFAMETMSQMPSSERYDQVPRVMHAVAQYPRANDIEAWAQSIVKTASKTRSA